ncbi:hypothetical protein, partial [Streptomyces olivaceus]|uniref:hypothetical protein n=1 Tax=Streptomyces olivaceus TaxID=47716 RepID=UPI003664DC9A
MRTVWAFPGQGSQRKDMGAGLFDRHPEEAARADAVLGRGGGGRGGGAGGGGGAAGGRRGGREHGRARGAGGAPRGGG